MTDTVKKLATVSVLLEEISLYPDMLPEAQREAILAHARAVDAAIALYVAHGDATAETIAECRASARCKARKYLYEHTGKTAAGITPALSGPFSCLFERTGHKENRE